MPPSQPVQTYSVSTLFPQAGRCDNVIRHRTDVYSGLLVALNLDTECAHLSGVGAVLGAVSWHCDGFGVLVVEVVFGGDWDLRFWDSCEADCVVLGSCCVCCGCGFLFGLLLRCCGCVVVQVRLMEEERKESHESRWLRSIYNNLGPGEEYISLSEESNYLWEHYESPIIVVYLTLL